MERRNTIQREVVLEAVRTLGCHATADEIYAVVTAKHPSIGKGTVYRNLGILSEEGLIRKISIPGGADCYDHVVNNHYHVQCVKCGRTFDVDMELLPDLRDKITDTHGFEFLEYSLLFKGICPDCRA